MVSGNLQTFFKRLFLEKNVFKMADVLMRYPFLDVKANGFAKTRWKLFYLEALRLLFAKGK